jgi:hypothetical protein
MVGVRLVADGDECRSGRRSYGLEQALVSDAGRSDGPHEILGWMGGFGHVR